MLELWWDQLFIYWYVARNIMRMRSMVNAWALMGSASDIWLLQFTVLQKQMLTSTSTWNIKLQTSNHIKARRQSLQALFLFLVISHLKVIFISYNYIMQYEKHNLNYNIFTNKQGAYGKSQNHSNIFLVRYTFLNIV